jgi:putative heme-binding domain-containing protein
MRAVYQEARQTALDDSEPLERRQEAVRLLATAPWEELQSAAESLLEAWQPLELQLAAVEALAKVSQPQVTDQLLENFAAYTPTLREAVISAIFARAERVPHLLDAIEQDRVPPSSVDASRRDQLLTSRDRDIVERAARLLSSGVGTARREEVLRNYHAALQLPRNDRRGKEVFTQQCSKCHKLDNEGYEVGPDLATARTRADETLLSDVLDPSSQLTVGYSQYTVLTQDGRVFTGVLAAETATSITLRAEEGKDTVILRKDIEEMKASAVSMMPEDLEKTVSVQDLADLLGFLRKTLGPPPPSILVLLDEDEQILSALNEGEGIARWETTDCFAGRGALAVGPPQRFSATIPDWAYRIREHPEPGEFRYLRFAWKQPRGQGVMLELAADGQWPAAEQTLYRYYSGSNSTGWAAIQIHAAAPSQWTIVTRDLWQDFGSFTLTGMAPTALGDEALFDRIELLRSLE